MNSVYLAELGWPCPTGAEMRAIDGRAIEACGLPARQLMENAGRAAAAALREAYPHVRRPLVVCGAGNNGGDGFALARILRDWDARVAPRVLALPAARRSPESQANLELYLRERGELVELASAKEIAAHAEDCDLAVDAVFGVGLARPLDGSIPDAFAELRGRGLPVVALDLPSGLSADTGEALGGLVAADLVISFGLPKLGLALRPLPARVCIADIGLPWSAVEAERVRAHVLGPAAVRARLPQRPAVSHKGSFGHVLVIGGSEGKTGAAVLAAEGALRAGAGLVTAAAPRTLHAVYEAKLTEPMTFPVEDGGRAAIGPEALARLLEEARMRDVAVVGPGLGRADDTLRVVPPLLAGITRPTVVDADGLFPFSGRPEALRASAPRVLTPHPGELARLLGRAVADVERDRTASARELAERAGAVVVAKGARSVIAAPDGRVRVNPTGGPGLASGGTGDVLAGAIAALLAQGLEAFEAASVAAYLHGLAGDALGTAGVAAGDVARALPAAWRRTAAEPLEPDERDLLRRFP